MDRFDERKSDAAVDADTATDTPRSGDILGLGGGPVPKAPDDPVTEHDPESVARRRERARSGDVLGLGGAHDELDHGAGATGIDMGSGGTGTDVE